MNLRKAMGVAVWSTAAAMVACGGGSQSSGGPSSADASSGSGTTVTSTPTCISSMSTWTPDPTQAYTVNKFGGKYAVQNNRWGTSGGQALWVKDHNCWGITTNWAMSPDTNVLSYPSVVRGWLNNGAMSGIGQSSIFSSAGTQDWTTNGSGMGIAV
jgi:hypothetical protein